MRFAILVALVACSSPGRDPVDQSDLDSARAKWEPAAPRAYSFLWQENCLCTEHITREIRIFVVDNAITSATYTDDQTAVPDHVRAHLKTIDGLFDMIQEAIDLPAFEIAIMYDATLGWPSEIRIDHDEHTADEELYIIIKDVNELTR